MELQACTDKQRSAAYVMCDYRDAELKQGSSGCTCSEICGRLHKLSSPEPLFVSLPAWFVALISGGTLRTLFVARNEEEVATEGGA